MEFMIVRSASEIPSDKPILGFEVPGNRLDLINKCSLGNLDPQHGGTTGFVFDEPDCATCIAALDAVFCNSTNYQNAVGICTCFDLDAAVSMVVVNLRSRGDLNRVSSETMRRLRLISEADSFVVGVWQGVRPLPTEDELWMCYGGVTDIETLAVPNHITGWAAQGRITLKEAVRMLEEWLLYGEGPKWSSDLDGVDYWTFEMALRILRDPNAPRFDKASAIGAMFRLARKEAMKTRRQHLRKTQEALSSGRLCVSEGVVYVDATTGPFVPASLAYCMAPISVIRQNDPRSGYIRYSVASFDEGRFNQPSLAAELTLMELDARIAYSRSHVAFLLGISEHFVFDGDLQADVEYRWGDPCASSWGGPFRMVGSPQNSDSLLTKEQVLDVVKKHINFR
ncbi:hypothetical protein HY405_01590 [Candidatus Microgenomates bacterium]|nr:hypothetical protein [Candidatus Microgenomates bacterium]